MSSLQPQSQTSPSRDQTPTASSSTIPNTNTNAKQGQGSSTNQPESKPSASANTNKNNKRKRVSRACDQCFSKKDRCDGSIPICDFCAQQGRTCTYDRPERKRGPTQGLRPKLENRIADLEALLGLVIHLEPNVQDIVKNYLRLLQPTNTNTDTTDTDMKNTWRITWLTSELRNRTLAGTSKAKTKNIWFGSFEEDLVSTSNLTTTTNTGSFSNPSTEPQQHLATHGSLHVHTDNNQTIAQDQLRPNQSNQAQHEEDDDESDYSEVDLSLPPGTHPLSTSIAARQRRRRLRGRRRGRGSSSQGSRSSSDENHDDGEDADSYSSSHYLDNDNEGDDDDEYSHHRRKRTRSPILPLLSSGRGGSSLNRGLVPKGTDPNAALGGFEIAFGGNEHDEHWVRDFIPPNRQSHSPTSPSNRLSSSPARTKKHS